MPSMVPFILFTFTKLLTVSFFPNKFNCPSTLLQWFHFQIIFELFLLFTTNVCFYFQNGNVTNVTKSAKMDKNNSDCEFVTINLNDTHSDETNYFQLTFTKNGNDYYLDKIGVVLNGGICFVVFDFKGRVHCFSMQALLFKVFSPKPWKKFWHRSVLSFLRKTHL